MLAFTHLFLFLQHIGEFNKFLYGFYLSAEWVKVTAATATIGFEDETEA